MAKALWPGENPLGKRVRYTFSAAQPFRQIIGVVGDTALLDLPIESSQNAADLAYEAHTERIPREGTKVLVILEPVIKEK